MEKLKGIKPEKVFRYFEEISAIPRGSGNMEGISAYCMAFAEKLGLRAIKDDANNVVIFKDGTKGYENSEPVILQGHLDMVCQKTEDCNIDFEKDGLDIYIDGDFIKAKGTTLGADNGIAVAMIMAVLESGEIEHPPIEAVFTTDEEIGLIGAGKLDMSVLSGKKMVNLDSEDPSVLTVSCAGGSDFIMKLPFKKIKKNGSRITISLKGLQGGHSGVEIDSGRVNADILMGRILNYAVGVANFDIISVNGGDKGNAIPLACTAELVTANPDTIKEELCNYLTIVKDEISAREPGFEFFVEEGESGAFEVMERAAKEKVIFTMLCAPNGVQDMSAEIENLVETSLNLGVLVTEEDKVVFRFALRSNKQSALVFLEEKLFGFSDMLGFETETGGHYPPWEFVEKSSLQEIYKEAYAEKFGVDVQVVAIHAGLECGLFSSAIEGIDAISIGPCMHDIHTVNEKLSISSTADMFDVLKNILKRCK